MCGRAGGIGGVVQARVASAEQMLLDARSAFLEARLRYPYKRAHAHTHAHTHAHMHAQADKRIPGTYMQTRIPAPTAMRAPVTRMHTLTHPRTQSSMRRARAHAHSRAHTGAGACR